MEKNLLGGWGKTLAAVLLLFASSAAIASPTVISGSPARATSLSADRAISVVTCNLGSNAVCDRMSEFGKALLQPPSTDGRTTSYGNHYLPAVPPALMMVLTGFICISFIRDRRTWLAVLAGLLWAGQTGINALPELTSRISRKVHAGQLFDATLVAPYPLGDCFPANYSDQTRYTGLLRHLAGIPRNTSAFTNFILPWHPALHLLFNCLASGTRQFICFTPAFIFNLMPRGPPISPLKLFCKPAGV